MQHDREYWRQHVLAHRRSGLTQIAYCLQNGLHTKTCRTWSRKTEMAGEVKLLRISGAGARAMQGAEELAYPLLSAFPGARTGQIELVGTVARRQRYTVEERQQHVLAALQSGLPIEHYARMAGLTPSALHRWKHKYGVPIGILPATPAAPVPVFVTVTVTVAATVTATATADNASSVRDPAAPESKATACNSVDIMLGNGRRLRVDADALRRVLAILEPLA